MPAKLMETMGYMQNRELSWLKFNERVLQEANRTETPLLERLKFIAIFTSNLDEFFMVRVGALIDYLLLDEKHRDNKTGMTAQEQLTEIYRAVAPLYSLREQAYSSVIQELERCGIQLMKPQDMDCDELKALKKQFVYNIMPLLSPQIIDSTHPFPHLSNKRMHIVVTIERKKGLLFGLIAVPAEMDRLVLVESGSRFVLLEDVIWYFSDLVFDTYKILEKNIISVTRNADIDTEEELLDEDIDFRQHMKNLLKKRQRLSPVRMEICYQASGDLLAFLCEKLTLSMAQVFYSPTPLDLSFSFALNRSLNKEIAKRLVWPVHVPAETLPISKRGNMLKLASIKDLLFSYPFESISPFLALIRQAAEDISVVSIKITLYRIDIQSKLAESLVLAAENGKEVIVMMELRARFDEKNNIEWAQRLEEAGCRVIYGLVGYKVHSKICLITRKEHGKIQYITQVGTGNYNEKTSKQYTDLSLITANQEIGRDAADLFRNLLLGNLEGQYRRLWVAPGSLKSNILSFIEEERQKAQGGGDGRIVIKCNSLTDKEIIEKLAEASRDGVRIWMIVRGICCIIPGIPKDTENIHVISIVGKFLEHSRIYCFGTGTGPEKKIYISSADLMTRNTERRVEVACPILDADIKSRIFDMLETMLRDNTQAWEHYSDGRYVSRYSSGADLVVNSQEMFSQDARVSAFRTELEKSGEKDAGGIFKPIGRAVNMAVRLFRK